MFEEMPSKQREEMLKRKRVAETDLKRQGDSLSREKLLQFVDKHADMERRQKRWKTLHADTEERKEQGTD